MNTEELKDLLANWLFLFTFGYTRDVYACGNKRKMIDRTTGEIIHEYRMEEL